MDYDSSHRIYFPAVRVGENRYYLIYGADYHLLSDGQELQRRGIEERVAVSRSGDFHDIFGQFFDLIVNGVDLYDHVICRAFAVETDGDVCRSVDRSGGDDSVVGFHCAPV